MEIEVSTSTKVVIKGYVDEGPFGGKFDPITVYITDYRPGCGKIVIECYRDSWVARWSAMSGQTVSQFFCGCDEHYLAGNLASGLYSEQRIDYPDWDQVAKKRILELRKSGVLNRKDARRMWRGAELELDDIDPEHDRNDADLLTSYLKDGEWWEYWPHEPNPKYEYLCRIIKAVQLGLKQGGLADG